MSVAARVSGVSKIARAQTRVAGTWMPAKQLYTRVAGVWQPFYRLDLLSHLTDIGLATNLKMSLDAGDSASLPAASTKWLDRSGGGYDLFRGTTVGADTSDPTINGTAGGLSASEYLSFDGGDYLLYDSANETWMQNIHKAAAKFTLFGWFMFGSLSATQRLAGTSASSNGSNIGFRFTLTTTDLNFNTTFGGSTAINLSTAHGLATNTWACLAVSLDEAANVSNLMINGAFTTLTGAYTTPSAASATEVFCVGSGGSGNNPLLAGGRCAAFAAWEGRALSQAEMGDLFQSTRNRFGV